jgi:hypothetical protein
MNTYIHLWYYLAQFVWEWEIFQSKFVEKIKTHFMFHNAFHENRAVDEIMWKDMVVPDRPQMKTKYGACALRSGWLRLPTHSEFAILLSTATVVSRTLVIVSFSGPGYLSWYRNSLRGGRSGLLMPVKRDFLHTSRPTLGPTKSPMQWSRGIFPRGKAAGAWRWPHSPSVPSWRSMG